MGTFKQWGDACSGTVPSCTVTMTANKTVTATFSQVFTDDPLTKGTPIKAVHVDELRDAIDVLRIVNDLQFYTWPDAILTARSTVVKKDHLDHLRRALGQAYWAALQWPPTYTTDPTIEAGKTTIKAQHILDLRTAVRDLEVR